MEWHRSSRLQTSTHFRHLERLSAGLDFLVFPFGAICRRCRGWSRQYSHNIGGPERKTCPHPYTAAQFKMASLYKLWVGQTLVSLESMASFSGNKNSWVGYRKQPFAIISYSNGDKIGIEKLPFQLSVKSLEINKECQWRANRKSNEIPCRIISLAKKIKIGLNLQNFCWYVERSNRRCGEALLHHCYEEFENYLSEAVCRKMNSSATSGRPQNVSVSSIWVTFRS